METTENDNINKINNKYKNGKIYTIRSNQCEKYYIGSTIQRLSKRLYEHKRDKNFKKRIFFCK